MESKPLKPGDTVWYSLPELHSGVPTPVWYEFRVITLMRDGTAARVYNSIIYNMVIAVSALRRSEPDEIQDTD